MRDRENSPGYRDGMTVKKFWWVGCIVGRIIIICVIILVIGDRVQEKVFGIARKLFSNRGQSDNACF